MILKDVSKFTEDQAREYLERIRWPNGPVCPFCEHTKTMRLKGASTPDGTIKCSQCRAKFTVRVGTIFERSHIELRTWLMAFSILTSSKKSVSAKQLQRQLGLGSYKSAWHMAHRIRHCLASDSGPLGGPGKIVELDETYVSVSAAPGGEKKSGHTTGRSLLHRAAVFGLVERGEGGRIKARVVANVTAKTLIPIAVKEVDPATEVHTDEWRSYKRAGKHFRGGHKSIRHNCGVYYRNGVTTNSIESFWSLLKRGITGSFHKVSREHLQRYVDEFVWRWSNRELSDAARTTEALRLTQGKRLMYRT